MLFVHVVWMCLAGERETREREFSRKSKQSAAAAIEFVFVQFCHAIEAIIVIDGF